MSVPASDIDVPARGERFRRRERKMEKFVIEGGVPLTGTMMPAGNKNGALPILASALLTDDEVVVATCRGSATSRRCSRSCAALGVRGRLARGQRGRAVCAPARARSRSTASWPSAIRASFLLAGPLLARFGRAVMPPPGGDVIGRRRLDPHLDAFGALGASVDVQRRDLAERRSGLRPSDVFMDEPSVMATENVLMAAALTPGTTVIRNAACEPHVQDLARLLVKMGADIQGIGSNLITVNGAERLHGCEHEVAPDHIEIGSFIALAGVTGGELRIEGHGPRRPAHDPPGVRASGPAHRAGRQRRARPGRPEARRPGRRRRVQVEDPGRARGRRSRPT